MAELFQTTPQNVTQHLKALYGEGEIEEAATCKKYFRRWATERLREYQVKGFTLDDERLKSPEAGLYFDQLWNESATFGRRRRCSGARSWTSTPPAESPPKLHGGKRKPSTKSTADIWTSCRRRWNAT
jgi:Virulence protein RhuM family